MLQKASGAVPSGSSEKPLVKEDPDAEANKEENGAKEKGSMEEDDDELFIHIDKDTKSENQALPLFSQITWNCGLGAGLARC